MHITNYNALYQALLKDFKAEEFVLLRKYEKKLKRIKAALGASYAMLVSAACFGSTEIGFTIIVAALVLIFYFQNKIKRYSEMVSYDNDSIEECVKPYINSMFLDEFRKIQEEKVKSGEISKTEYLDILREDVFLHFSLVKKDCIKGINIDVVNYKSSIEKVFESARNISKKGYLESEEIEIIYKKWISDLQVLRNQYANTDLEVEIKYLYLKSGMTK